MLILSFDSNTINKRKSIFRPTQSSVECEFNYIMLYVTRCFASKKGAFCVSSFNSPEVVDDFLLLLLFRHTQNFDRDLIWESSSTVKLLWNILDYLNRNIPQSNSD